MIENGVIEVKVKRVLETILMTEILLILSIKIPALLGPDVLNPMMVVNWQRRGEAISRIRSKLGLPHDRQRTIKSNKLTKKTRASTWRTHNLSNDSVAYLLESFFCFIHYWIISNKGTCRRKWRNGSRALTTTATCSLGSDTGTTSTITGTSRLGAASRLRDSGLVLVVLGPLLLAPRGTAAIHYYERDKTRLRTKEDRVEWAHRDGETCMGGHPWHQKCQHEPGLPTVGSFGRGQGF
jgi:hypothetical protein